MKKIVFAFLVMLAILPAKLFASDVEAKEPAFTTTLAVDFFNRYIGPSGTKYTGDEVYQPAVTIEHQSGLYLSVWGSGAFDSKKKAGNEIDYLAGWAGDVGAVSLDVGVGYYDFEKMFDGRRENAWALFAEVSKEYEFQDLGLTLTPSVYFEEDIPEPGSSYKRDFYTTVGVELRKQVVEKAEVYVLPALTYDNGVYGLESCTTVSAQLGVDISVSEEMKIKPTTIYYLPFEKGDRDNEFVLGIGIEYVF